MNSSANPRLDVLRQEIRKHTHADEAMCVDKLLAMSSLDQAQRERIVANKDDLAVTEEKLAQQELDFSVSKEELDSLQQRIAEQFHWG